METPKAFLCESTSCLAFGTNCCGITMHTIGVREKNCKRKAKRKPQKTIKRRDLCGLIRSKASTGQVRSFCLHWKNKVIQEKYRTPLH